ncbi:MAG: hypothetical protein LBT74_09175, partial [Acidobacteriota bacterium]|nr:hypothetical protein [Acidobacteriota bacterium]
MRKTVFPLFLFIAVVAACAVDATPAPTDPVSLETAAGAQPDAEPQDDSQAQSEEDGPTGAVPRIQGLDAAPFS